MSAGIIFNRAFRGNVAAVPPRAFTSRAPAFTPDQQPGLAAWYRFNSGIVVTGAGVSQWADASGNGRNLLQGTDANRPPKQGDGSILFSGLDGCNLKAGAFTLTQPCTVYLLAKQITFTAGDLFFDGNVLNGGAIFQKSSGVVAIYAGTEGGNVAFALSGYGVLAAVFNGAASVLQLNNGAGATGDCGAGSMGGFTLGSGGDAPGSQAANIQVKEVMVYTTAHDASTRGKVVGYLGAIP